MFQLLERLPFQVMTLEPERASRSCVLPFSVRLARLWRTKIVPIAPVIPPGALRTTTGVLVSAAVGMTSTVAPEASTVLAWKKLPLGLTSRLEFPLKVSAPEVEPAPASAALEATTMLLVTEPVRLSVPALTDVAPL